MEMLAGPNVERRDLGVRPEHDQVLVSVYAMRMAAVFTLSVSTVGLRTGAMPRWVSSSGTPSPSCSWLRLASTGGASSSSPPGCSWSAS